MIGPVVMGTTVLGFLLLIGGILAASGFPFVAEIPFGIGEYLMGGAPLIIAVGMWIFLMSLGLMRGSMEWKQMLLYTIIALVAYILSGGFSL